MGRACSDWDAWSALGQMPPHVARARYVQAVDSCLQGESAVSFLRPTRHTSWVSASPCIICASTCLLTRRSCKITAEELSPQLGPQREESMEDSVQQAGEEAWRRIRPRLPEAEIETAVQAAFTLLDQEMDQNSEEDR